jgi:hypothetical protein
MTYAIAFPDVEAALVGWLADVLPSYGLTVPVSTKVPNPRPSRFVRIFRTGGPEQSLVVDGGQVTVECWDDSETAAAAAARLVRAVLSAARNVTVPSGDLIYRIQEFGGPASLPDVSGQPRYSWTVQVYTRGTPLADLPAHP